ncbi:alpha/beta fold hydrolase [Undibacterium sp. CY7W]|uniref:Alpha/beta fold hydrolase n=1 Tax=Undibacterium rugosum TaxID=2762291 RepID=A0A923HY50_9BURK|nr:alpha/beta fold hydrolase [Undibacterium rugosum]MBC3934313.1 alpha/beta fold hydrolase [Undibacterium rugosum]
MRVRSILLAAMLGFILMPCQAGTAKLIRLERADGEVRNALVYPATGACQGVAVISHGAGGSEQGYAYLAQGLAEQGWLTVVPDHHDSGTDVLRRHLRAGNLQSALTSMVTDSAAYRARQLDINAARLWAQPRCNAKASVLIGHSMGAATTMMEAGAENLMQIRAQKSFDRYIALSPQGPGIIFPDQAWSAIRQPVLLLTGTRDTELGGLSWESRTTPFSQMPPGCKWLGVIDGATHQHFAGHGASRSSEKLIMQTVRAFLQADATCSLPPASPGLRLQSK